MKYKVAHATVYEYSDTVPLCHNEVHLTPREHHWQLCTVHRVSIRPLPTCLEHVRDYFGNHSQFFTIQEGHRKLSVTAVSKIEVSPPPVVDPATTPRWTEVRDQLAARETPLNLDALQFTYNSPQIVITPELIEYVLPSFDPERTWLAAVSDLMTRIYRDFKYDSTATTISTPLQEVLKLRRGVCQDFAHLMIGCLRAMGLSARYVSGYLLTRPPEGKPRLGRSRCFARLGLGLVSGHRLARFRSDEQLPTFGRTHHLGLGPRVQRRLPNQGCLHRRRPSPDERLGRCATD